MSQALQRIHVHHPALLKITRVTPQGEDMIMDELSSLAEGRIESDAIFPLLTPAVLKVTTLSGASYRFIIVGKIMVVEHLNDIEDVNVPSPADGYVLYWDAEAGQWQAKAMPPPPSRVKAWRDVSVQSIPTNSWTVVELNAEDYDEQDEFDHITTYRFTPKQPGAYLFIASARFKTTIAQHSYFAGLYKNAAEQCSTGFQSSYDTYQSAIVVDILLLTPGDYVEMRVWHNSGVNIDINHGHQTWMTIHKLS